MHTYVATSIYVSIHPYRMRWISACLFQNAGGRASPSFAVAMRAAHSVICNERALDQASFVRRTVCGACAHRRRPQRGVCDGQHVFGV